MLTASDTEENRMEKLRLVELEVFERPVRIPHSPSSILDVGCGSGIWAREVAKAFPRSQVCGVDISPTFVSDHPDNLHFEVTELAYLR